MKTGRRALLALLFLTAPMRASAQPPVRVAAGYGPAAVVGIGASSFEHGHASDVDVIGGRNPATGWVLHLGSFALSRPATLAGQVLLPGGEVFTAYAMHSGVAEIHALAGLRRAVPVGRVEADFETVVGAAWIDDDEWTPISVANSLGNIAWTAAPFTPLRTGGRFAPAFGGGVAVAAPLPGSIALRASISARFLPLRGLAGAIVPIEVGARWPASTEPAEIRPGARSPRLRAAAGWSALHAPRSSRSGFGRGSTMAVALEFPLRRSLALCLAGEQIVREQSTTHYTSTNGIDRIPDRSEEGTVVATIVTAGVRVERPIGFTTLSLRAGTGWGKTGGFGTAYETGGTAFVWNGIGAPANGWAFAIAAGAEVPVAGPVRAFVEAGESVLLVHDTVAAVPVRLGLVLR